MATESDKKYISDFLLQVSNALSFKELGIAYKIIRNDYEKILAHQQKNKISNYINRFDDLLLSADNLLKKETNGIEPTVEQIAVFGEMILLLEVCNQRLTSLSKNKLTK